MPCISAILWLRNKTVGQYRVTMKINFIVNINDNNRLADPRPPLQGDTAEAAVNRAVWCWLKSMSLMREMRRTLGVGRSMTRKADIQVVAIEQDPSAPGPSEGPI